jgi:adenine phosphoribosyltransferase
MFRDITTLLKDPAGFRVTINEFVQRYTGAKIDKIAAIESRGFIIGAALASWAWAVPARGQAAGRHRRHDYQLEYDTDRIEIHVDGSRRATAWLWMT